MRNRVEAPDAQRDPGYHKDHLKDLHEATTYLVLLLA